MRLMTLFAILFSSASYANIVARVVGAEGNAFVFESNGKSKRLSFGSRIYDMAEIMVDDTSYVSILDSSGNMHHLAGGTYAKFYNQMLELKNGYVWTVAKGDSPVMLNTLNSIVRCSSGQFITAVDSNELKTQILALTGDAKLSSSLEPELAIDVPAGHFSFIDQSYESGLPRAPTRVGLKSYQKMRAEFAAIKSLEKSGFEKAFGQPSTTSRGIASVKPEVSASQRGKIIFIKSVNGARKPASVEKKTTAMEYYQNMMQEKKRHTPKRPHLGKAQVRHFGFGFSKSEPVPEKVKEQGIVIKPITVQEVEMKAARVPASASPVNIVDDINSAFEKSLKNQIEGNKRHPEEVNQLIDELKSYKSDYSKHY